MGREIDERVVQMKFENGQFEKGISTSIRSMEELKKGMNFDDAVKGFNKLDEASKGIKLIGLANGVEAVRVKFDLLQITAFNVLNRISNKAIDTGERMIKGLSIDQVSQGWGKFEDKTQAVQTIMAATSKQFSDTSVQMQYVNDQLDKLNWFTDETSYNFVDMVSNIGKFTSNNIALDESVTAMQGIANWAAISGANANEASRAMYNLSQAMASGSLRLMDWMSIENANMGTAAFKEMAIQMALTAGTLKKQGDTIVSVNKGVEVSVEKFRDTLSTGWLNKEVLMNTLNEYGQATNKLNKWINELSTSEENQVDLLTVDLISAIDDYQAGTRTAKDISEEWGISLEKTTEVLEDFNSETDRFGLKAFKAAQEAKTFSDAINATKDAVSTGWMKSFEYIFGDYLEAKDFWSDVTEQLYELFAAGSIARNKMLHEWKDLGGRNYLVDAIQGVLMSLNNVKTAVSKGLADAFGVLDGQKLFDMTKAFHSFILAIIPSSERLDQFSRIIRGGASVINIFITALRAAGSAIGRVISVFMPFAGDIFEATATFGDMLYMLSNTIKELRLFDIVFGSIADVVIVVVDAIRLFTSAVSELIFGTKTIDEFSGAMWHPAAVLEVVFERLSDIANGIGEIINKIISAFKSGGNILESLSQIFAEAMEGLTNPLGDGFLNGALDILNSGLFAALLLQLKKFIDKLGGFDITKVFKNFRNAFEELGETIGAFEANINAKTMQTIATAILTLAAALLILAAINPGRLTSALGAISVLFIELSVSMKAFSKAFSGKFSLKVTKISTLMIGFSAAILILSSALKKLSGIDAESLATGLGATVALIASVTVALKTLSTVTEKIRVGSVMLISLAASINILAVAVGKLGTMNMYQLQGGLLSVGALLGELVVFINLISGAKVSMRSSVTILAVAASLSVLSGVIGSVSSIPVSGLQASIAAIGALLTEISLFMKFGGNEKGMLTLSASLILFSSAISSLSTSLITISSLSIQDIAKGVIAIGAALGTIGLTLKAFPKNTFTLSVSLVVLSAALRSVLSALTEYSDLGAMARGIIAVGGALIVIGTGLQFMQKDALTASVTLIAFGTALRVLSPALQELSEIGIGKLITTLGGLAIAFAGLGLVAAVLQPISPALRSLSATIAIFSASVLALGVGVTLLSTGLAALGGSAVIGVGGLSVALLEVISLIPVIIKEIGVGIIAFADVITEGAPRIAKAFIALVTAGLDALSETVPEIVDRLLEIFQKIIATLLDHIPSLGDALSELFHGFSTEGFKEFAVALWLVLGSIMGSMKILQNARGISLGAIATLGVMIVASGLIGVMLAKFSSMTNPISVIPLATAISEVFLALAASFTIIGRSGNNFNINIVSLGVMIMAIGAIAAVLSAFANMTDPTGVIPLAAALSLVMIALAGTVKIMSTMTSNLSNMGENIAAFAVLSVIAGLLGAVIAKISQIVNPEGAIPIALSLSAVLLALGGVVAILHMTPPAVLTGAWSALAMMGVIVVALGALTVALGELMKTEGFRETLQNGIDGMKMFGEAIGGFFGGIVKGFSDTVLSVLPNLGTYLSQFMENAQNFFNSVKNLPDGLGSKVAGLAGAIIAIGAADFLTSALNFAKSIFGDSSADLATKFENFGKAIGAFSNALGEGFNADKVQAAANAGKALADLERSLPRKGGKLQEWLGEQNLEDFGNRLEDFGEALSNFGKSVVDLPIDAVTAAANAGKLLSDLENSLPAQDGVLQYWLGEKDLSDFSTRLTDFGNAIVSFSSTVAGNVDEDAVAAATNAGTLLSTLESSLQSQGGFLQTLMGEKSLGSFGQNLTDLGTGLVNFSNSASNISVEAITAATGAIEQLVLMESQVDQSGGWGELFTGKSDFSSFGSNLEDLGEAIEKYDLSISAIKIDKINETNTALKDILNMSQWTATGINNLVPLANNLNSYGPAIGNLSSYTSGADTDSMGAVREEIENLLKLSELTSATEWIVDVTTHAKEMVSSVISALQDQHIPLYNAGKDIAYWLIAGVKQGMTDEQPGADKAARNCADGIKTAFEDEAGIASPSTVMIEEGHWLVKGLAEGITSDMSAEEAAEKKASNIVSAFESVLDKLDVIAKNRQLKYDVWSVSEGLNATEEEATQHQLTVKQGELEDAATKVKTYQAAFKTAQKSFDSTSKQYIEAENRYLEALKSMYEIRNEIDQMQSSLTNTVTNKLGLSVTPYAAYIEEYKEAYKSLGYSAEKLMADAMAHAGEAAGKIDTNAIINSALADQTVEIVGGSLKKAVSSAARDAVQGGSDILGEGGTEGGTDYLDGAKEAVKKKIPELVSSCVDAAGQAIEGFLKEEDAASPSKEMYKAGVYYMDGFINAVKDKTPSAVDLCRNLGVQVLNALKVDALNEHSASKETNEVGVYFTEGLNNGIESLSDETYNISHNLGTTAVDGLVDAVESNQDRATSAVEKLGNAMSAALEKQQIELRKVILSNRDDTTKALISQASNLGVNLSGRLGTLSIGDKKMISQLEQLDKNLKSDFFGTLKSGSSQKIIQNVNSYGSVYKDWENAATNLVTKQAVTQVGNIAKDVAGKLTGIVKDAAKVNAAKSGTTYSFTQNNYSPKALNRSEIYRQTNNQFSRLKGASQK